MLNLDHLACFIEVASQRSFTKAAERLFLSQSTVSRRVSHLEEELGCRLIERTALDFELTPEGKTTLELGSTVLEKVTLLQNRVKSRNTGNVGGTVAVGFCDLFRHLDVAGELRRRMGVSYPQVHIDIRQRLLRNLTDDFRAGHVDIAVVPLASPDVSVDLGIAYRRTDEQNCAVLVTAETLTAMGSTASL